MEFLNEYWRRIDWPRAALFGGLIILAVPIGGMLDEDTKWIISVVILAVEIPIGMLSRLKSARGLSEHPVRQICALAWCATIIVWFAPAARRDYLPPSSAIDAGLIAVCILMTLILLPRRRKAATTETSQ